MLDAEGGKVRPLETESGFWRIDADRKVEVVMTRDDGVVEIWYGELADKKPQIDLVTDAVARTAASGPYSGGKRLYGYVNSDLMWVGEKQTPEVELRPYMSGASEEGRHPGGRRALGEGPPRRHAGRRDRLLQVGRPRPPGTGRRRHERRGRSARGPRAAVRPAATAANGPRLPVW